MEESRRRTVYLGRQPIYGANREIRAYEMLYRRAPQDTSAGIADCDGDQASADIILKAILDIGLPAIAADRPVFINHTRTLLMMDPILPADRCVLEALETVVADGEILAALERFKSAGYKIVLDDFVLTPETAPLLTLTTSSWTTGPG